MNLKKLIFLSLLAAGISLHLTIVNAQAQGNKPILSPLFTDNMVLQRGINTPVWGWTTPGAKVTVSVAGKTATATADGQGKWMAKLSNLPVGGPYTLKLSGPQEVTLNNVMVGDVWICSGQSNMEMGIGVAKDAQQEIAKANYPNIRLFTVQRATPPSPQELTTGTWSVCTPQTVAAGGWGGFSAVGYYFGRTLNKELNIPIGLLHTSWGGTIAEAWTSGDALKKNMPDFVSAVQQVEAVAKSDANSNYDQRVADWYVKNDPGSATSAHWQSADADTSSWKTMTLPAQWEQNGLPDYDGVVWFSKEVTLPDGSAGKDAILHLGAIDDLDTTWVNGVQVGVTNSFSIDRKYTVPGSALKPGKNVITVRVMDTGGAGGIYDKPETLTLTPDGGTAISLAGEWKYMPGADSKKSAAFPVSINNNPNVATVLYNGMIAPLVPYGIKGAIWYQGESNADRAEQYSRLLPTMITDWRDRFGVGQFPFYIVQLASFMVQDTEPRDDAWPHLREAQYITTQKVPNSALATAIDIGDAQDIHPKNKQEVGRRLALDALALTYGRKIEYYGPLYKSMKVEGSTIRLSFDHLGGGLVTQDGASLKGFAIAGADKKFVWADAKIDGNTVVVSSPQVPNPTAVHYAWSNNPVANLANKAGLPAFPFRTDGPTVSKTAKK